MPDKIYAQVTAFNGSCLLHCAAHKIAEILLNTRDEKLSELNQFSNFVEAFNSYYAPAHYNLLAIKKLLEAHAHPIDRELIFGPVLRFYLKTLYIKKSDSPKYIESLFSDQYFNFYGNIKHFIEINDNLSKDVELQIPDNENLYHSNRGFFQKQRLEYLEKKTEHSDLSIANFLNQKKQNELKNYWTTTGYQSYSTHIANNVELSAAEAAILFKALDIGLQEKTVGKMARTKSHCSGTDSLTITLEGGHWYYEAKSESEAKKHNECYSKPSAGNLYLTYSDKSTPQSLLKSIIQGKENDNAALQSAVKNHVAKKADAFVNLTTTNERKPLESAAGKFISDVNDQNSFEENRLRYYLQKEQEKPENFDSNLLPPPTFPKGTAIPSTSAHQVITSPNNTLRKICEDNKLFSQKGITQIKNPSKDGVDEIIYKKQEKETLLKVSDDRLECAKPNDLTIEVLLTIFKASLEAGNNDITIEGATKPFRERLMEGLKKIIENLSPEQKAQGITVHSPEEDFSTRQSLPNQIPRSGP